MNNFTSISANLVRAGLVLGLVVAATIATAQQSDHQIGALKDRSAGASEERQQSGKRIAAVMATPQGIQAAGLQFRISYDPAVVRVTSTDNCLVNLPKVLSGSLHSCKNIPDRNLIQVVITDLSGRHAIPGGFELGFVEFEVRENAPDALANSLSITDVHVSKNVASDALTKKEVGLDVINF